jgi:hypothetical protein
MPFAAYNTRGRRDGDTRSAHRLGGTIASIARATTSPVSSQPSQFVSGIP